MGLDVKVLERLEPGLGLAEALAGIDRAELSPCDRIPVLQACHRQIAHYQSLAYTEMAEIVSHFVSEDDDYELAYESASAEIAAALHLTRRAADYEIDIASELADRLPQVGALLGAGRLDLRRVRTFIRGTGHLQAEVATAIVEASLERAERMTAGQLDAYLRRQCFRHDPESANKRYQKAIHDRRVVLEATESGAANLLGLDLPADLAAKAMARISALAESAKMPGDDRSVDQLRADVYLDLLLEGGNGKKQGVVNLHVDLATLTEQQTRGEWRYTIDDPETGQPLANGITRRRPTTAQRRRVETLNPTCVHPGCRTSAMNADLDHNQPWAQGGPTQIRNLEPLCQHHHTLKHRAHWTRRRLPDGDHLFTSRLGHHYTTSGRSP